MGRRSHETSKRVRTLIDEGAASIAELTQKLGRGERTRVNSAIQNLVVQGKLVRTGRGGFKTTDKFEGLVEDDGAPRSSNGASNGASGKRRRRITRAVIEEDGDTEFAIRALERQCEILGAKLTAYKEALRFLRSEEGEEIE